MKYTINITRIIISVALISVVGFFNNNHAEALSYAPSAPIITSISPQSGAVGTTITLTGTGFTNYSYQVDGGTNNRIVFGSLGSENNPVYDLIPNSGGSLTFKVPEGNYMSCWNPKTGPACRVPSYLTQPGQYDVSIINANGQSNKVSFIVTDGTGVSVKPQITSLSVSSGKVNTQVTVYGTGFTRTGNAIKFGNQGTENNPKYVLDSNGTSITFNVPESNYYSCWNPVSGPQCNVSATATAPGVYNISVINNAGESNNVQFTVVAEDITLDRAIPQIITPNGGENYIVGQIVPVYFKYDTNMFTSEFKHNLTLELLYEKKYTNGSMTLEYRIPKVIASNISFNSNDVLHDWKIDPSDYAEGYNYKLRATVTRCPVSGKTKCVDYVDVSNAVFSISPSLVVNSQILIEFNNQTQNTSGSGTLYLSKGDSVKFTAKIPDDLKNTFNITPQFEWVITDRTGFTKCIYPNYYTAQCKEAQMTVDNGIAYYIIIKNGVSYRSNTINIVRQDDVYEECTDEKVFTKYLYRGMRNNQVEELQELLVELGFLKNSNSIDGNFGRGTRSAVMKFQRTYGLYITGTVNRQTREKLNDIIADTCELKRSNNISN